MRNLKLGRIVEFSLVVAMLALGRPVLVPIALALYLAFVLTPVSDGLERLGLPRALSVAGVIATTLASLAVLGSVLVAQAADLARQMQTFSSQISQKLSGVRAGQLGVFEDLSKGLAAFGHALDSTLESSEQPTPVRLVSGGLSAFATLEQALGPLVQPVAVGMLVLVLTIFVLGYREDLRGRLIQLVGPQNVTVTTRTMAEAVKRVSHLLLAQVYINAGFGAVAALGLYFIGVPYALLWGVIAALLRFVPLLGTLVATLLPALVAFAIFPGWREALLTVGMFLVIDVLLGNFVEPLVLGKRTGVSALALLVCALFWTWLWGPMGLVLATPLTICAAVMGRHVPELSFLTILLGDEPGLNPQVNFYQRILAKATKDAHRIAKRKVLETSLPEAFDELLIPALSLMVRDQNTQAITQSVADRVVKDTSEVAQRLSAAASISKAEASRPRVMGIAAESLADVLLLELLEVALAGKSPSFAALPLSTRAAAVAEAVRLSPSVVCIAALLPSGNVNARFLCRRLKAELPDAYLLVLLAGTPEIRSSEAAARLRQAGANRIVYGVQEAASLIEETSSAVDAT